MKNYSFPILGSLEFTTKCAKCLIPWRMVVPENIFRALYLSVQISFQAKSKIKCPPTPFSGTNIVFINRRNFVDDSVHLNIVLLFMMTKIQLGPRGPCVNARTPGQKNGTTFLRNIGNTEILRGHIFWVTEIYHIFWVIIITLIKLRCNLASYLTS